MNTCRWSWILILRWLWWLKRWLFWPLLFKFDFSCFPFILIIIVIHLPWWLLALLSATHNPYTKRHSSQSPKHSLHFFSCRRGHLLGGLCCSSHRLRGGSPSDKLIEISTLLFNLLFKPHLSAIYLSVLNLRYFRQLSHNTLLIWHFQNLNFDLVFKHRTWYSLEVL